MKKRPTLRSLFLSLLSVLLFSLPWLIGSSFVLTIFSAFIPLFILQRERVKGFLWWVLLTFFLWIVATCWWVGFATPIAYIMVPIVGLFFTFVPFALWHRFFKDSPALLKWTIFITGWITFEALYMYGDISFPWLTLGYAFGGEPLWVQWYSVTGAFGGSLWILLVNVLLFERYQIFGRWFLNDKKDRKIMWLHPLQWISFVVLIGPMIVSSVIYCNYDEKADPVTVTVVQPNIDPYSEKFSGMTNHQQLDTMLSLASKAPSDVDFIVAPETALNDDLWLDRLSQSETIDTLRRFIAARYPEATMVVGATILRRQAADEPADYETYNQMGVNFKVYNSALWVDSSAQVEVYHKSKLVVGAEMIPYPAFFGSLGEMMNVDLGGFSGHFGRSDKRAVVNGSGVAICYESVYGEYFTSYVHEGAQVMFVITNDGWWGDTPGYKGLLRLARLRAVETRRSIARSANTGVSALINQRGDVVERLGWDRRGVIYGTINANQEITFYVTAGDYIARLSMYVLALSLLYSVALRFKRKDNI